MTSYGSETAVSESGSPPKLTDFDTIEAEIDTIKAEVQDLRAGAEHKQGLEETCAMRQQHDPYVRAERSRIPAPAMSRFAPARTSDSCKTGTSIGLVTLPGTGLSSVSPLSRSNAGVGTGGTRGHAAATISPTAESSSSAFATCTTAIHHDVVEHFTTELLRMSPHFAQPTQAATRRVDETLRKETSATKPSPETTPGKSTKAKAPDFATDKRAAQRGQKRTSLPDGWMSSPDQSSPAEKGVQKKEQILPGSGKTPNLADQSPSGPTLRKKTSSYMSPTKAAQNRSIATMGEDKQGKMSPRVKTRALRLNTNVADKDSHALSSSSSRGGNGSDNSSSSPRSQSGFTMSKKESSSPLRNVASAKAPTSSALGRPSLVIRLPMPLPHVANTTMTHRNPNKDLLDPIKEKLRKEDLLRRDSTQESSSPVDRSGILAPVFARLNRIKVGPDDSSTHSGCPSGEGLRSSAQSRPRDPDNEPMTRLISGLRGQSSANIGKALAGGQHEALSVPSVNRAEADGAVGPAAVCQSRKRSGDPAILYQGRKPSASHDMPQDPAIIFNSGPLSLETPSNARKQRKTSQPRSLRATATYFVPEPASDPSFQTDPPMRGMDDNGDFWWPKSLSLFDEDDHVDHGTGSLIDMGFLPENPRRYLHDTLHGPGAASWQDESMLAPAPAPEPRLTLSRHFDLIHGNTFDTPTASPTSDDTSSPWVNQQRQRNLARWEITGKGRRRYHWTGGDGLEISFKGVGPDAEHDPNSPVVYRNYRENTGTYHMQAASYPKTHAPGSLLPPNAPKLMRDYAERMALSQIPCNEHQWRGKYDLVPAIIPVPGLCDPCKQSDKLFNHVGGGVESFS
jgi:hypothetical protein